MGGGIHCTLKRYVELQCIYIQTCSEQAPSPDGNRTRLPLPFLVSELVLVLPPVVVNRAGGWPCSPARRHRYYNAINGNLPEPWNMMSLPPMVTVVWVWPPAPCDNLCPYEETATLPVWQASLYASEPRFPPNLPNPLNPTPACP